MRIQIWLRKKRLEAQVDEALKYALEKEEETWETSSQLREAHKGLKMQNNGTNQLYYLLNIGKSDRYGLRFQGKSSKVEGVFV